METFLLIGITIVAAIWIIRKENKKLKNTSRLHRSNKTFSEECVKLLKYEKYGCYKLTGMQYKCLKQADYGVHHGYAIAEGNNQYDNAVIIKRKDNGKIIACVENDVNRNYMILSFKTKERYMHYITSGNMVKIESTDVLTLGIGTNIDN